MGVIFTKCNRSKNVSELTHGAKTLYIEKGQMCFNIFGVDTLRSDKSISDGTNHIVAVRYSKIDKNWSLYVDEKL